MLPPLAAGGQGRRHPPGADLFQCAGRRRHEAGQLRQIPPPEILPGREAAHQRRRVPVPMLCKKCQHRRIIPDRVGLTIPAPLAVKCAQGREGEGQTAGNRAESRQIGLHAGQYPRPPFGDRVEGNIQKPVVDIGVVKALLHRPGEGLTVLPGQREGRDDLLKKRPFQVGAHSRIRHAVPHNVVARQIGGGYHGRVPAVEYAHLLLLVGVVVGDKFHRQAGLWRRELLRKLLRALDHPQSEGLRHVQQPILQAEGPVHGIGLLPGIAGDNPIHQGAAEGVLLLQPPEEPLPQRPVPGMAQDIVPQHGPVIGNQLTGEDQIAGQAGLIPLPQQTGQLGRKAGRGSILRSAGGIVDNAGLCGIGDDQAHIRVAGGFQKGLVRLIDVYRSADAADHPALIHSRSVQASPQAELIKPLLAVDAPRLPGRSGRDNYHLALKVYPLVHDIDKVVRKASQEVALSKLQHPFRGPIQEIAVVVPPSQCLIAELFHKNPPSVRMAPIIIQGFLFVKGLSAAGLPAEIPGIPWAAAPPAFQKAANIQLSFPVDYRLRLCFPGLLGLEGS